MYLIVVETVSGNFVGLFCFPLFSVAGTPSCLAKLNQQRHSVKEVALTEDHPFIYTLKNKSSWKIDGKSFAVICHFSAMILHIRNILMDMLASWSREFPQEKVADTGNLGTFMVEWASSLTSVYSASELKTEYAQCCSSLEESQGKSVVFANLPTKLGEYLKENLTSFYNQYCIFEEEEGDDESNGSVHGGEEDDETESDGENGEESAPPEQVLEQEEGSTEMPMFFCSEVQDEPDIEVDRSVVQQIQQVGSPQAYKSTSLNVQVPALGTVPEEEEATFDDDEALAFLRMLEDKDMECMFGDTPEALKLSLRNGQVKGTVEEVTMALLDCKHAGTWEQKHIQLESTVSLSEHPQQQEIFNSFVEINIVKKPHTDHKGVRTFFFLVHFGFLCQVLESVRCLFAHFFVFRRAICFSLMHGETHPS